MEPVSKTCENREPDIVAPDGEQLLYQQAPGHQKIQVNGTDCGNAGPLGVVALACELPKIGYRAHTHTLLSEVVSYAVFGILKRIEIPNASSENIRTFKKIVKHPQYKPPSVYHDIALLELNKPIPQSDKIRPACLHVGSDINDNRAYATGWGALGHKGPNANILQNVPLWKKDEEKCKAQYPPHRVFVNGYDNITQMCYGDDGIPRDTCQGDSGGPLQILNPDAFCTYLIIGVTSVGNTNCAQVGYPGLYTRVSYYVPWIESVVWPWRN